MCETSLAVTAFKAEQLEARTTAILRKLHTHNSGSMGEEAETLTAATAAANPTGRTSATHQWQDISSRTWAAITPSIKQQLQQQQLRYGLEAVTHDVSVGVLHAGGVVTTPVWFHSNGAASFVVVLLITGTQHSSRGAAKERLWQVRGNLDRVAKRSLYCAL